MVGRIATPTGVSFGGRAGDGDGWSSEGSTDGMGTESTVGWELTTTVVEENEKNVKPIVRSRGWSRLDLTLWIGPADSVRVKRQTPGGTWWPVTVVTPLTVSFDIFNGSTRHMSAVTVHIHAITHKRD